MDIYQQYTRRVDQAANRLAPIPHRVDLHARDRDDYRQLLMVKVMESSQAFQEDPGQSNSQEKWVGVAIYNQMISYFRGLTQAKGARYQTEVNEDLVPAGTNLENQMVARDLLRRVAKKMDPDDWGVLVASMENGIKSTWEEREHGCSYGTFRRRVFRVRSTAQKNVKKLVPGW